MKEELLEKELELNQLRRRKMEIELEKKRKAIQQEKDQLVSTQQGLIIIHSHPFQLFLSLVCSFLSLESKMMKHLLVCN